MTYFEEETFRKFQFTKEDIHRYFKNSIRDLEIAQKDSFAEVQFTYSYQALVKSGVALLAKIGSVKVRSVPGHHVKILSKMSEILGDRDIAVIGNTMRMKRNTDLYGGGQAIGQKEAQDYLKFVETTVKKVRKLIESA